MNFKKVFILVFILNTLFAYSLKFNLKTKNDKDLIIQGIFDMGFSAQAVADDLGITDYESVFFKPAFHIQDFGIGLVFDFRFRLFTGQISFRTEDWSIPGDPLNTFILYLDKINYITYGNFETPIFVHTGRNPVTTLGTGFLIRNFHNHFFLPTSRENGLFFKFNGNYLNKFKMNNFPIDVTFITTDFVDPDIFVLDCGLDIFHFTKLKNNENLSLRIGQVSAVDINTGEHNRLSSLINDEAYITSHRNLSTTDYDLYTSFPLFTSCYADFIWKNKLMRINGQWEFGFLFDFFPDNFNFGFGTKLGAEARFVNLKKSGYLVGVNAAFIAESNHYKFENFSSNYEIVRTKQYQNMFNDNAYTFYFAVGFGLYGFYEKINFNITATIPVESPFKMKIASHLILEDTLVKGLFAGIYYETGVNILNTYGEGDGFINFLTNDFRFSAEAGYKFFGAKLKVLVGIQKPAWIPDTLLKNELGEQIERFVSLEISFVL